MHCVGLSLRSSAPLPGLGKDQVVGTGNRNCKVEDIGFFNIPKNYCSINTPPPKQRRGSDGGSSVSEGNLSKITQPGRLWGPLPQLSVLPQGSPTPVSNTHPLPLPPPLTLCMAKHPTSPSMLDLFQREFYYRKLLFPENPSKSCRKDCS